MLDENSSASESIRKLLKVLHTRLEQNEEDFRALLALQRVLAEVTGSPPERQLQTTLTQASGGNYGSFARKQPAPDPKKAVTAS